MKMEVKPENENSPTPVDISHRTLLKISIGVLGGSLVAVPLIPGLSYLTHPLLDPRSRFVGQSPVKIQHLDCADAIDSQMQARRETL